jgi:hypothetical protein
MQLATGGKSLSRPLVNVLIDFSETLTLFTAVLDGRAVVRHRARRPTNASVALVWLSERLRRGTCRDSCTQAFAWSRTS